MKKLTVTLIYRCRYFPCTEQSLFDQSDVFFYNNVASFASTHSKTLQSDVTGRRQHGIRDHSSISTLMTKLLRKQWILTISPLVSDCRIDTITLVFPKVTGSHIVRQCRLTPYTSMQNFISKRLIVNMISLSASIMYGTINFWQIRCCPTLMSLILHQHIRKHAIRM